MKLATAICEGILCINFALVAMEPSEIRLDTIDDLVDFVVGLEKRLAAQQIYDGINLLEPGPCRVLQLDEQEEMLFQLLSSLTDPHATAFEKRPVTLLAETIGKVNFENNLSNSIVCADGTIITHGIFRAASRVADFDAIKKAVITVVQKLKADWNYVGQAGHFINFKKHGNLSGGLEENVEVDLQDVLMMRLLKVFQFGENDVIFQSAEFAREWSRDSVDERVLQVNEQHCERLRNFLYLGCDSRFEANDQVVTPRTGLWGAHQMPPLHAAADIMSK